MNQLQTKIATLGEAKIASPLSFCRFVPDSQRLQLHVPKEIRAGEEDNESVYQNFEEAGPRQKIYYDPTKVKCAIVTCGGLCPGINDVIRAIVMEAHHHYNVASILGIRFGLQGFVPEFGHEVIELTPAKVSEIHEFGGTMLGSSRGHQSPDLIVDALERMNISVLFMIGGDGTMKAAQVISRELRNRKLKISIIGIPKTIDNDIHFISKTFGFDSAVAKATESIRSAHVEAIGAPNGIGMVKLMGRESGFIAAQSTLALKDVNFVLIPEIRFDLHGENGLLRHLEKRLEDRGHAVIVVAEGAGQEHFDNTGTDASGNVILGDICNILCSEIKKYFSQKARDTTLKFIDPSYIIRSIPANANDRVYCGFLGQNAVHAAMSGKTELVVSMLQDYYIHLPLSLVTQKRRRLDPSSNFWSAVLESTGQPFSMCND